MAETALVSEAAGRIQVHYYLPNGRDDALLAKARQAADSRVDFHSHSRSGPAPAALADGLTPATLVVLLPDGREFPDEAGVDILHQLARGTAPGQLRPPRRSEGDRLLSWDWLSALRPAPAPTRYRRRGGWQLPGWLTGPRFGVAAWVYLRLVAAAYLLAFSSAALQLPALVGPEGLYPVTDRFHSHWYWGDLLRMPTLMWFSPTGEMLVGQCLAGVVVALLLLANVAPGLMALLGALLYLSVFHAGGFFFENAQDMLLVEAGFFGALLAPWALRHGRVVAPPMVAVWLGYFLLLRYLTFPLAMRLMFSGQWSKLETVAPRLLGDGLPSPAGWWLAHAPFMFLELIAAIEIAVLLAAPLLLFFGGNLRRLGGVMLLLWLLGQVVFLNLTPAALVVFGLAVLAFDDRVWLGMRLRHPGFPLPRSGRCLRAGMARQVVTCAIAVGLLFSMMLVMGAETGRTQRPVLRFVGQLLSNWQVGTLYPGESAIWLQNTRREYLIEGSDDGETWKPYVFKYRPGPLKRRPPWLGFYRPRLQAMAAPKTDLWRHNWMKPLIHELLEGNPRMDGFFSENPFPDSPPRHLRVTPYAYTFAPLSAWWEDGHWWQRRRWQSAAQDSPEPSVDYRLEAGGTASRSIPSGQ